MLSAGIAGALIGMAIVLGWQSWRAPDTWEECMFQNLDKAKSRDALYVLKLYCRPYPRRAE